MRRARSRWLVTGAAIEWRRLSGVLGSCNGLAVPFRSFDFGVIAHLRDDVVLLFHEQVAVARALRRALERAALLVEREDFALGALQPLGQLLARRRAALGLLLELSLILPPPFSRRPMRKASGLLVATAEAVPIVRWLVALALSALSAAAHQNQRIRASFARGCCF